MCLELLSLARIDSEFFFQGQRKTRKLSPRDLLVKSIVGTSVWTQKRRDLIIASDSLAWVDLSSGGQNSISMSLCVSHSLKVPKGLPPLSQYLWFTQRWDSCFYKLLQICLRKTEMITKHMVEMIEELTRRDSGSSKGLEWQCESPLWTPSSEDPVV